MTADLKLVRSEQDPDEDPIRIDIDGRPAPKGSRIAGRTKTGRSYTRPASKFEAPWIHAVRDGTRNVMRHHTDRGPPYAVELRFRIAKTPYARYEWPVRADLDKLVRAVLDGLVLGGALTDDQHVIEILASERYAEPPEQAGVTAFVRSLA